MINNFFIVNSSGSMIYSYQKEELLTTNQLLVLCGSLHSVGCMVNEINNKQKIPFFFSYQTKIISYHFSTTNLSFIFISDRKQTSLFKKVHEEFCNYALLNPFYILDMPINCEKFNPKKYFD